MAHSSDHTTHDRGQNHIVVLVVEDEPLLRMMAVDMVEDAGFEAIEATNSADAINQLETRRDIRIVFSDIDMPPGIDGKMLAAIVRNRWPPIEIILVSGQATTKPDNVPERTLFFSKPFRQQDVVAAMTRLAA